MKEARKKDLPLVKMSQTLLTTRRLLYWSYQIGKRQTRSIYTIFSKKEEQVTVFLKKRRGFPQEHVKISMALLKYHWIQWQLFKNIVWGPTL
jgi:hypothetical protein